MPDAPHYSDDLVTLYGGDCLDVLRSLPDESIEAVVCDPPYGLSDIKPDAVVAALTAWAQGDREHVPDSRGFMNRAWDAFVPPPAVWDECLRVLKPGGHLLAFAGSRTADLMGLSVRLAGFEIRDTIMWVYGSGMPKGISVGKAIDKMAGAEREIVGRSARHVSGKPNQRTDGLNGESAFAESVGMGMFVTAPATPEAARWEGWNTALKPAQEPIIVARKPLAGKTVAATVLAHGTGAINVDACRVGTGADKTPAPTKRGDSRSWFTTSDPMNLGGNDHAGRWPANVVLVHAEECVDGGACADGCPVAELDRQSGTGKSTPFRWKEHHSQARTVMNAAEDGSFRTPPDGGYSDSGGASRFFAQFRYSSSDHVFFPVNSVLCGDESTGDASTSAGRNPASKSVSSPTGGSGSRSTDPSPRATRSTTGTTTRSTTTSTTSCASPLSGTTTTISDSASSTAGLTGSSSAGVSGATSGSPSPSTTSAVPEPGRATAVPVSAPTVGNGSAADATSSTRAAESAGPAVSPPDDESRFFPAFRYQAKAPTTERPKVDGVAHPTCKPLALMRWLVRLVTPPGGTIADPFSGSGTTLEAAMLEGFHVIGVERQPEYLPLIGHRIERAHAALAARAEQEAKAAEPTTGTLFDVA